MGIIEKIVVSDETLRRLEQDALAHGRSVADEVARMSLFLTTGAARHITGQLLHVSHGALTQFA